MTHETRLKPSNILKLAGVRKTQATLKLATWCANNLVLIEEDCPYCGQTAPDDCDYCPGCDNMQCQCACSEDEP